MYERFNEALCFAAECHAGQLRKMGGIPYILHPMEVAAIIGTITNDEDVLIAGILHDTVEDCGVELEEIRERFGPRAAALVRSETEDTHSERPPEETWRQRKEGSLLMLEHTGDRDVKILWLADKLSNMRSFYREHLAEGDQIWLRLHQKDPKMQEWYYRTILSHLGELSDTAAYAELTRLIDKVFSEGETI